LTTRGKPETQTKKVFVFRTEVAYLGHIVSTHDITCNPDKTESIKSSLVPQTRKEVRSCIGLVGYYKRFIANFIDKALPLTQ